VAWQVPYKTQREMQRYFHDLDQLLGTVPKPELFEKLSPSMTRDVLLDVHGSWLRKLPFFTHLSAPLNTYGVPRSPAQQACACTGASHEATPTGATTVPRLGARCLERRAVHCFVSVQGRALKLFAMFALRMQPALFIARERPPAHARMYVIVSGIAMHAISKQIKRTSDNCARGRRADAEREADEPVRAHALCVLLTHANLRVRSLRVSVRPCAAGGAHLMINNLSGYDLFRALTFLQVVYLDHEALMQLVTESPEYEVTYRKLRAWALLGLLPYQIPRALHVEMLAENRPRTQGWRNFAAVGHCCLRTHRGIGAHTASTAAPTATPPPAEASPRLEALDNRGPQALIMRMLRQQQQAFTEQISSMKAEVRAQLLADVQVAIDKVTHGRRATPRSDKAHALGEVGFTDEPHFEEEVFLTLGSSVGDRAYDC
jgi:hypothetical protein